MLSAATLRAVVEVKGVPEGNAKLSAFQAKLEEVSRSKATADLQANVNSRGFDDFAAKINEAKLKAVAPVQAKLSADSSALDRAILDARRNLLELDKKKADPEVKLDKAAFDAEVAEVKAQIRELGLQKADVSIRLKESRDSQRLMHEAKTLSGGGGGGGGGLKGLGSAALGALTPFGKLGTAAVAASPVIVDLAGALTALTGSFAEATAGAGALGVGLGGVATVGIAGIASVAVPAISGLKKLITAQTAYTKAIASYGRGSTQAATALKGLRGAERLAGPDATALVKTLGDVKTRWTDLTKAGQGDFLGTLNDALTRLQQKMPLLASSANSSTAAFRKGFDLFQAQITGSGFNHFIETMTGTFARVVPQISHGLADWAQILMRIADAAAPSLERVVGLWVKWSDKMLASTSNAANLRQGISHLVNQTMSWIHLLGAAGRLLIAVFGAGAGQGQRLVDDLTGKLKQWTGWINSHQAATHAFFKRAADTTRELGRVLTGFLPTFMQISEAMRPIAQAFLSVTKALNSIKIGNVSALTALLTAYVGLRGVAKIAGPIAALRSLGSGAAGAAAGDAAAGGGITAAEGAAGGAGIGLAGTAALVAAPIAIAGLGAYMIANSKGSGAMGAKALAEAFSKHLSPEIDKALKDHKLGKLEGLTNSLKDVIGLSLKQGASEADVKPMKEKLAHALAVGLKIQINKTAFLSNLSALKSGAAHSFGGIEQIVAQSQHAIAGMTKKGSQEAKNLTVQNMQAEVTAIRKGISDATISRQEGLHAIKRIMHEEKQVMGTTNTQMEHSAVLLKVAYERTFDSLNSSTGTSLKALSRQVYEAFKTFAFNTKTGGVLGQFHPFHGPLPGSTGGGRFTPGVGKQQGGFIVPGSGDGDKFHTAVPANSFILNREATPTFGFAKGGLTPVALEAGERVFLPHEVQAMGGPRVLESMNRAVPRFRFASGGIAEPRITGPSGELKAIGQGALHMVFQAAQKDIAAHKPKGGGIGAAGNVPTGPITQMAREMVSRIWGKGQFGAFNSLEMQEAGWNPRALNPSSGAAGLAQALPASKYPAGAWPYRGLQSAKLQLEWMMGYIKERYGSPAGAWAHEQSAGWYAKGGLVGLQKGGSPGDPRRKWAGWDALGQYHGAQRFATGGSPKTPKRGSASDAVAWAMHHIGSGDQWGYPGEWCGAFIAADMQAQKLPVPGGFASAASWAGYGSALGRNNVQAGAILDYGSAHVALATSSSKQVQGNDMHGQVGTSGIGGIIGGSPLTAVRWPPYSTAPGAGSSPTEKVPGSFEGVHTAKLSLGSTMPKSLHGVEREIKQRQREITHYRKAAGDAKGAPALKRALEANVKALEVRLNQLYRERTKLRQQLAQRKFGKGLSHGLGQITGFETAIAGKQRLYEEANQFAEQVVDLEPTPPELPASASEADRESAEKSYVAQFGSYINGSERPAFAEVLGREADWRNTILGGEGKAAVMEAGWEEAIHTVGSEVEAINRYTEKVAKDVAKWQHEHPKQGFPDALKAEVAKRDQLRSMLPNLRFEDRELRKVLGEGREEFYPGRKNPVLPPTPPLAGTGSFEEALIGVQGTHWPKQHEPLGAAALAPPRVPGNFGGAIWDTQSSIEELGLKIAQASASLGAAASGESGGKTERDELLEGLLREANQRNILRGIEERVFAGMPKVGSGFQLGGLAGMPWAGAFAGGGVVGALVGERGPEIAAFPTGTRIHSAGESRAVMQPNVAVHLYEGEGRAEVYIDEKKVEAMIQKHDRRSARGAGRGLAPAGRFG